MRKLAVMSGWSLARNQPYGYTIAMPFWMGKPINIKK